MCAIDSDQLLPIYWELQHRKVQENARYIKYKFILQLIQKVPSYIPKFQANRYV